MTSKKKLLKVERKNYKRFPTFSVSSYPIEPDVCQVPLAPTPEFTPVYGSLYNTQESVVPIQLGIVDFNAVGPSSDVTLDIVNDSITVNSPGIYTITFSTVVSGLLPGIRLIEFNLSINGTPDLTKQAVWRTDVSAIGNERGTLSRTDQLMLNAGDVIQIAIGFISIAVTYSDTALVVTKVA